MYHQLTGYLWNIWRQSARSIQIWNQKYCLGLRMWTIPSRSVRMQYQNILLYDSTVIIDYHVLYHVPVRVYTGMSIRVHPQHFLVDFSGTFWLFFGYFMLLCTKLYCYCYDEYRYSFLHFFYSVVL